MSGESSSCAFVVALIDGLFGWQVLPLLMEEKEEDLMKFQGRKEEEKVEKDAP